MKLDFLCLNSVEIINQKILPNLSIIGNISKYTSILIINGENDSQTTVQQAFLLQQRLTDVEYPNHTLITYPNLGHLSILHLNGSLQLVQYNSMF